MYKIHPPKVFIHQRVYDNPLAVQRLERMLHGLGNPATEDVDAGDTDRVLAAGGLDFARLADGRALQGRVALPPDPVVLFNTFVWDAPEPPYRPELNGMGQRVVRLMAGVGEDFAFSRRELVDPKRNFVCQGGWGIHSMGGCLHRCAYCPEGGILTVMLDLEDFGAHVSAMLQRQHAQKIFRYDLFGDAPCLEPEYGASALLSDVFARTDDQYLLYYTKSDNVEHLLDLPHKSHAIFYCTLGTDTACRVFEPGAPSLERRIAGMRRCQDAGYVVRAGFSPIIPVRNWREEATRAIEALFAQVQPDTVRLWVLSLMTVDELTAALDPQYLDEECLAAARHAHQDVGWWNGPFPLETRTAIYRHYIEEIRRVSPRTPVSLCSEERPAWDNLADTLRMSPDRLFCCCGGTSKPR